MNKGKGSLTLAKGSIWRQTNESSGCRTCSTFFPCSPLKVSGIEQTVRTIQREVVLSGEKVMSSILGSALYCLYLSLRPQNILDIAHLHVHIGHKQRRI